MSDIFTHKQKCPTCGGSGTDWEAVGQLDKERDCPSCENGERFLRVGWEEECDNCTTGTPTKECPWFRENCHKCHGTGKVITFLTVEQVEKLEENYVTFIDVIIKNLESKIIYYLQGHPLHLYHEVEGNWVRYEMG